MLVPGGLVGDLDSGGEGRRDTLRASDSQQKTCEEDDVVIPLSSVGLWVLESDQVDRMRFSSRMVLGTSC